MALTGAQLELLLSWLDPDPGRAAHEYNRIYERLKNFFTYDAPCGPEADELANVTIDLVAEKLKSPRLSNAGTDILDMPTLCAGLANEGKYGYGPRQRIMEFLPEATVETVRAVSWLTDFQQRGSPLICHGDIKDVKRLIRRLLNEDYPPSAYFREQLWPDVLRLLREFGGPESAPELVEKRLAEDLNRLIREERFLEVEHFARLASENRLRELIGSYPGQQKDHVRVNRLLVEKAFPDEIAKSGRHAARLSKALNGILEREDFYLVSVHEPVERGSEVDQLLKRGGNPLSQDEVGTLNRLLLEATFPQEIAKRLIDRQQYEDRWPYFVKTARYVYLKQAAEPIKGSIEDESTSSGREGGAGEPTGAVLKFLWEKFQDEIKEFIGRMDNSREYACLKDCCQRWPTECYLVMRYYQTGDPEKGGAGDSKNRDVREEIAEDENVSGGAVRNRVYRARARLKSCINECLAKRWKR